MSNMVRRAFLRATCMWAAGNVCLAAPPPKVKAKSVAGMKPITSADELPLPAQATARLGTPKLRVPGYINRLQFSPKGTTLIAASGDEIRAWDPTTGKVLFRLAYPEECSVDSGRLTSRDTFVLLVRLEAGNHQQIQHYAFTTGHLISKTPDLNLGNIQHSTISTDGSLMAFVRQEGLCLIETGKGTLRWQEPLPPESVSCCLFSADEKYVILGAGDSIQLRSVATGKAAITLNTEDANGKNAAARGERQVNEVVQSNNARWLAAGIGERGLVVVWDLNSGKILHRLDAANKPIAFIPDAKEVLSYGKGSVTYWSLTDGTKRTFDVPNDDDITMSPNGRMLACGSGDAAILVDARTGKQFDYSSLPPGIPERLEFHERQRLVGRLDGWGGWVEWSIATGMSRLIRPAGASGCVPVVLSVDQSAAIYTREQNYELRRIRDGAVIASMSTAPPQQGRHGVHTSPDGLSLIGWKDGALRVVSALDSKERAIARTGSEGQVGGILVSADGRLAALALNHNGARADIDLFDLKKFSFLRRIACEGDVAHLSMTPDGAWLAVASDMPNGNGRFAPQGNATVFETHTGRPQFKIQLDENREHLMAISTDGRSLARVERRKENADSDTILVWEVMSGAIRRRIKAGGSVAGLAFSPDGRTFAASVRGAPVFLFDLHSPSRHAPQDASAVERAWDDLRSANAVAAFDAVGLLVNCPEASLPLLKLKVTPIVPPDNERVSRLITELDHRDYRKREAASKELGELGERVRGALVDALNGSLTPETRARIERLLAADAKPSPDLLRQLRAIEAVEAIGTVAAARLLADWGTGAAGATLTRSASAAALRLQKLSAKN